MLDSIFPPHGTSRETFSISVPHGITIAASTLEMYINPNIRRNVSIIFFIGIFYIMFSGLRKNVTIKKFTANIKSPIAI